MGNEFKVDSIGAGKTGRASGGKMSSEIGFGNKSDKEKKFASDNLPGMLNGTNVAYLGTSTNHSTGTGASQTTAAFNA